MSCRPAAASQAERGQERVLEEIENSSKKCLTNRKEYAILQSLKRTPVESINKRNASKRKCYGAYRVRTLTTQEWKAEQQLARPAQDNAQCLQFLSILRTSQATTCFGLDRKLTSGIRTISLMMRDGDI